MTLKNEELFKSYFGFFNKINSKLKIEDVDIQVLLETIKYNKSLLLEFKSYLSEIAKKYKKPKTRGDKNYNRRNKRT